MKIVKLTTYYPNIIWCSEVQDLYICIEEEHLVVMSRDGYIFCSRNPMALLIFCKLLKLAKVNTPEISVTVLNYSYNDGTGKDEGRVIIL